MKQFTKYAAVGVAGYLIGFYEMKYKVTKAMLKGFIEKDQKQENSKEESEEAQS